MRIDPGSDIQVIASRLRPSSSPTARSSGTPPERPVPAASACSRPTKLSSPGGELLTNDHHLERAIASVKAALEISGDNSKPEWSTELEPQLDQVRENFAGNAILDCLAHFVDAELDFKTSGERGLGRLSTMVPRDGAHFRKHLHRLTPDERREAGNLIKTQILTGYLSFILPREDPVEDSMITDGDALYRQWIPQIYSSSLTSALDEENRILIAVLGADAMQRHLDFLGSNRIKGGGFFSPDKTNVILFHFHLAGFSLRPIELLLSQEQRAPE